jgi:hypothetical protein
MKSKSLLDPKFKYRSSAKTDLRKTFARIKREQRKAQSQTSESSERSSPPQRSVRKSLRPTFK